MWYQIDFNKLSVAFLPTFLRKPLLSAWVKTFMTAIIKIYDNWLQRRNEDLYKLAHTGQIFSLRKSLNDAFDPTLRRIELLDGNQHNRIYIYTALEHNPVFLPVTIYSRDDYADTGVDFIVKVPMALYTPNNYELKAHTNLYKQDIKRYKIIT